MGMCETISGSQEYMYEGVGGFLNSQILYLNVTIARYRVYISTSAVAKSYPLISH